MLRNPKPSKGTRCHGDHYSAASCSLADDPVESRNSNRRNRDRPYRISLLGLDRPRLSDPLMSRRRQTSMNDLIDGMGAIDIGGRGSLRDRLASRNSLLDDRRRKERDDEFEFRPVPFRPGVEADRLLNRESMQRRRQPLVGLGDGYRRTNLGLSLDGMETRGRLPGGLRGGLRDRRDGLGPDSSGGLGRGPGGGLGGPGGGMGGGFNGPGGLDGGLGEIAELGTNFPNLTQSLLHPRYQPTHSHLQNHNLPPNFNPHNLPFYRQRPQLLLENHDPRALDRDPFPYGPYPGWQPNYRHPYVEDYTPEEWEEYQMQEEYLGQMQMQQAQLGQLGNAQLGQGIGQGMQLSELQQAALQQQQQQLGLGLGQLGGIGYGVGVGNGGLSGVGSQAVGGLGGMNGLAGGLGGVAGLGVLGGQDGQADLGVGQGQSNLGGLGGGGNGNGLGGRTL